MQETLKVLNQDYPENEWNYIHDEEYLKLVRQNYYWKLVGCGKQCITCQRVCDKDHQSTNYQVDRHECRLGHQPKCFAGFRWSSSQFCSLNSCESYPDDYRLKIEGNSNIMTLGQTKTWGQWKVDQMFKEWNLEYKADEKYKQIRRENWERMKEAWDVVGQRISEQYGMKFQSFKNPVELNGIPIDPQ